jgi:hypothetical protein
VAKVERDMRAASEHIADRDKTWGNLKRHGEDTTEAARSNGILEHTQLVLHAVREQLTDEPAALDKVRATGRFSQASSSSTRSRCSSRCRRRSGR